MKKFLILALITIFATGCDDGIIKVENLDFADSVTQSCGNLVFKLNDNEALLISLPEAAYNTAFTNKPTAVGVPILIPINSDNRVLYRFYDGTVSSETVCNVIPPINPKAQDEWIGISGNIQITTTAIIEPNTDLEGGQKISGYKHQITFKNITFQKEGGNQFYDTFVFGVFQQSVQPISFVFDENLEKCTSSNLIFNIAGSSAFTLNIDPNLILSQVTTIDLPRVGYIEADKNILKYTKFAAVVTSNYYCGTTVPTVPAILETYTGVIGVTNLSGIIEVTTTTNGTGFLHEIHLKKVTLTSDLGVSFLLADDYFYGQLITN